MTDPVVTKDDEVATTVAVPTTKRIELPDHVRQLIVRQLGAALAAAWQREQAARASLAADSEAQPKEPHRE